MGAMGELGELGELGNHSNPNNPSNPTPLCSTVIISQKEEVVGMLPTTSSFVQTVAACRLPKSTVAF